MDLFKEIVNESVLLNELNSSRDKDIIKAINNVLRVRISYDDKKKNPIQYNGRIIPPNKGKKTRYILPVAYGLLKNGKRAIRAYQTMGSTKRGAPKWKLFLVDNIFSWTNGQRSFKEYAETLKKLGLNTEGDKHMTTLFAITPLCKDNVPVAKTSEPIDSEPLTKIDVAPTNKQVQSPNIVNKTNDFVPSSIKNNPSIDNKVQNDYPVNKVISQSTEPITKTDIEPSANDADKQNNINGSEVVTTEPITKDNINGVNKDNKLSNSFKDMMDRMDNLNKDNEDEEEK